MIDADTAEELKAHGIALQVYAPNNQHLIFNTSIGDIPVNPERLAGLTPVLCSLYGHGVIGYPDSDILRAAQNG